MTHSNAKQVNIPKAAIPVLDRLHVSGYEAYVVGGAVRDLYLGIPIHDIDIATDAHPETVMQLFPGAIPTAPQHGTVTVPNGCGEMCEVTTFRSDGVYDDARHPTSVTFGRDIVQDLARRDFTVNAMALKRDGELIDPYGGRDDLVNKVLRCVGDATDRFAEDALRMLRALRFASVYELNLHKDTYQGILNNHSNIEHVSRERIGSELYKLSFGNWRRILPLLAGSQLFSTLGPPFQSLQEGWTRLTRSRVDATDGACPRGVGGMAAWYVLVEHGAEEVNRLCKTTAMGKKVAISCRDVVEVVNQIQQQTDEVSFSPQLLYDYGRHTVAIAVEVVSWLNQSKRDMLQKAYLQATKIQPLWTLHDLAINGRHISEMDVHGRTVGLILQALVQGVLSGQIENRQDLLLREVTRRMERGEW